MISFDTGPENPAQRFAAAIHPGYQTEQCPIWFVQKCHIRQVFQRDTSNTIPRDIIDVPVAGNKGDQSSRRGDAPTRELLPARIGRYRIERKLGEGGMGIVYAARDDRLERTIALKTLPAISDDETARQRLWREAKAAAAVNHPNICQVYEVGEDGGRLFIAMELLEGESLGERLQRGPLGAADTVAIGLGMLSALSVLHARGIVHRDLKPSNVFLTPHGLKLLDFGLARPELDELSADTGVTRPGLVMGTPRYMAPEQVTGDAIDTRSDLFAAGAILFEALAGRPAFSGRSIADVLHATRFEQPPALTGSSAVAAIDRVIRRAMAKRPAERYASADAMAEELRAVTDVHRGTAQTLAHTLTRLVVLPFRVLRPDPETDFLAFSLPDAIATSLSGSPAMIVRSSAVASRFSAENLDLRVLAAEADVDRVVLGTLMRSGDQLRATAQLIEAPGGTLLTSHTVQASLGDLFGLQDDIARRVSEALSLPLTGATAPLTPDAPHDPRAYELYLRANELARSYDGLPAARDLYQQCLELDPRFAPAWAHLARCHRVIGKYIEVSADSEARAEEALRRALALSPRLTVAHKFYAYLEADIGNSQGAVVRLLGEAARHGNDPELFAGLVQACRYCGLYEESLAAHTEARRLDPNVPTSFEQTLHMAGDLEPLLNLEPPRLIAGADDGIRVISLGLAGRRDEALERLQAMRRSSRIPLFLSWIEYLSAWLNRDVPGMAIRRSTYGDLKINEDPEAMFQEGWLLCDVGQHEAGLDYLRRAVSKGYFAAQPLAGRPQFDALRDDPAFRMVLDEAVAGRERALSAFRDAGGDRLLGT
jgi:serine/threonine protein kinase/tetratricopeptide (TPR) repeat protein